MTRDEALQRIHLDLRILFDEAISLGVRKQKLEDAEVNLQVRRDELERAILDLLGEKTE